MAKISHDAESWRAGGLVKKYEDWEKPPTPGQRHSGKPKKKSDKWCKGQEGHQHNFVYVTVPHENDCYQCETVRGQTRLVLYCRMYGKHGSFNRCSRCNIDIAKLSKNARRTIRREQGILTEQETLELKWCDKGHLYDWVPIDDGMTPGWRTSWYREKRKCVMCGLVVKYRR